MSGTKVTPRTRFGAILRSQRERVGISASSAARRAGVDIGLWRHYENGFRLAPKSRSKVEELAKAIDGDAELLVKVAFSEWVERLADRFEISVTSLVE